MMPAAKHGDPQMGVDVHLCVVPPSPSPVPLPTPHLSVVFDPFDYLPFIGATVSVFGMKRATAGTGAIVVHIPPGFPFAPILPEKDDELFMGSSTVLADGDPFSYLALPVLGCQVAGMPSPPRPKKRRVPMPTLLPTTFNLAIPTTVKVGGPPTVSLMGLAFKGLFAGLGKLAKSKFGKALGDRFSKFRQKVFKNMDPGFLKCKVLRAEPVNILSGEVVVEQADFRLPGAIAIEWVRSYGSNSRHPGSCGHGWETPADSRLEIDCADGSAMFRHPGEGPALFPVLPGAAGEAGAVLELMDGARLSDHGDEFRVRTKGGLVYRFPKQRQVVSTDGLCVLPLGRIEDGCGNWLDFQRAGNRLRCLRDSGGRHLMFDHHDGRICRIRLSVPETGFSHTLVSYEHDASGDLVAVHDALGQPYRFAYQAHRLVRHTNRNGLSFHYEYDRSQDDWRAVHAWGDGGLYDYRFTYWTPTRETRITDSLGHVWTVQCDSRGLPVLEIDPLGGRTLFEYDEAGRTTAMVNPANHRTEYVYDPRGNLRRLVRLDGSVLSLEVDEHDKVTATTDPQGATWRQVWDSRGRLLQRISPLGAVTVYEHDERGQLVAVTDPCGGRTGFTHDGHGHLTAVVDALGQATRFRRDELGRVLERTDALGRTTGYCYDAKGRLVEVHTAGGGRIRCRYDAEDNLTDHEDDTGACSHFDYIGLGQISRWRSPDGQAVHYHYDSEEQLVGVTNPRGETHHLRRDALGRVVEEVDGWGQSTRFAFDAAGRLLRRVDAEGRTVDYRTDPLGRIRCKTLPHPDRPGEVVEESYDFDANGRLVACANEHGRVTRRFDAEGRLVEECVGGVTVFNRYDAAGRRLCRESSTGHTVSYAWDPVGRCTSIGMDAAAPVLIERDAAGQVLQETLAPGLLRHHRHDGEGRRIALGVSHDGDRLFDAQYRYDTAGRLIRRSDSQLGTDAYRYDSLGQVCEHLDPLGHLQRFVHDAAGDRMAFRVVAPAEVEAAWHGPAEGRGPDGWRREGGCDGITYRFDRAGHLVERQAPPPQPGGPAGSTVVLCWDANGRLVRSEKAGRVTRYGYDPLGRRLFKDTAGQRTCFAWDGNALLAEWPAGAVATTSDRPAASIPPPREPPTAAEGGGRGPAPREYVYYPDTFVPLALWEAGERYFFHNEANGAPSRLTRGDGRLVWAARYRAWGRAQVVCQALVNPLRLQGQYEDEESGLHYNRHRYYDADAGLFVSRDPLGWAVNTNPYRFAANTLTWMDPLGLAACSLDDARRLAQGVPDELKQVFKCKEFAESLKAAMQREGLHAEEIILKSDTGMIWSDAAGKVISTNGDHVGIKVGDQVFDNLNPQGKHIDAWMDDLGVGFPGMRPPRTAPF
ncbi:RHS repeat-associated core domain-containing protein [Eleftheria terrae]|uniref:RHS repeat-associated core domain-containing protein n=1 Tax=Eleftheria terrae TaxID=1597781 RepID=UPI00263B1E4C|nr:RHS repeat-associated core domain-containing protein [Eleftheria terrae]WKB55813.1 DUF6531 domain-containing protein [Eleftheria terrae]